MVLHSSIGGTLSGLSQGIYGVYHPHGMIRFRGGPTREIIPTDIMPPSGAVMWAIVLTMIVIGILAARIKIRAVEVIS